MRPPAAAMVELKGAMPYCGVDAGQLGEVLRIRNPSRLRVDVRLGMGPSITIAATASSEVPQPDGVLAVAPSRSPGG
ncbi:hypothetical protein [Streptomyces sp. NPDC002132]|uniref:hypothetical protein n=1 Tax=unclassified Streptomyces TaxID=2593676 RepID=UPI0033302FFD